MEKQRIVTAAVAIPLVVAVLLWGGLFPVVFLTCLMVGLCLKEAIDIIKQGGEAPSFTLLLLFSLPIALAAGFGPLPFAPYGAALAAFFLLFILVLARIQSVDAGYNEILSIGFLLFFVSLPLSHIAAIRAYSEEGGMWLLFYLIFIWLGDTVAYFTGRKWGKTKLAPIISPGKTVEGAIGQIIACTLFTLLCASFFKVPGSLGSLAVFGMVLSCAAITSDLAESLFKRKFGVKDSGTLLPGHGGMLDRVDSFAFSAPLFFWFLTR